MITCKIIICTCLESASCVSMTHPSLTLSQNVHNWSQIMKSFKLELIFKYLELGYLYFMRSISAGKVVIVYIWLHAFKCNSVDWQTGTVCSKRSYLLSDKSRPLICTWLTARPVVGSRGHRVTDSGVLIGETTGHVCKQLHCAITHHCATGFVESIPGGQEWRRHFWAAEGRRFVCD